QNAPCARQGRKDDAPVRRAVRRNHRLLSIPRKSVRLFLVRLQTRAGRCGSFELRGFGFRTYSFVIVSSRFKIARDTIAQAATLCRFTSGGTFLRSATATASAAEERFSKYLYCSSRKRR